MIVWMSCGHGCSFEFDVIGYVGAGDDGEDDWVDYGVAVVVSSQRHDIYVSVDFVDCDHNLDYVDVAATNSRMITWTHIGCHYLHDVADKSCYCCCGGVDYFPGDTCVGYHYYQNRHSLNCRCYYCSY